MPNGYPCLDTVIQTLGMSLDFRQAQNTRLAVRVFLSFFQVSPNLACLNHSIRTRESIWYLVYKVTKDEKQLTW